MAKWILNRTTVEVEPVRPSSPASPTPPGTPSRLSPEPVRWTRNRILGLVAGAAVVALVLWAVLARRSSEVTAPTGESVRTAAVERRDFVRSVRIHGIVEAMESYTVAAPRLAGQNLNTLVITHMVPAGSAVKRGDLLVEFDRQNQIKTALDRQAEYRDFVEQIKKKQADQATAKAHDDTEIAAAVNAVQSAELDMRKNEILARIEAEKNELNLEESRARLKQLRETYELKRRAAAAEIRGLEIQRDRASNAMKHAQANAEKMAIRSPMDGVAVMITTWKGGQMAEMQEGDEVRAGVPFLQVVNPAAMQVRAKVNQADVPMLRVGQTVQVRLDAYNGMVFPGRLERVSSIGITSGLSQKVHTFTALFIIQGSDAKLTPDLSAAVDVELERRPGALVAPLDAVFRENGKSFVRVARGSSFEKRAVVTGPMSDTDVVLESGVEASAVVLRGAAGS
jgi:HlyD family secretion protein